MTSFVRVVCTLALLAGVACDDPTLFAGEGPEALSEEDAGVDAGGQASRDAGDDGRTMIDDRPDPNDLWRYLPKECRSCPGIRPLEDCPFGLPRTIQDIENLGCYECFCCEEQTTCRSLDNGWSCSFWSGDRGSTGLCRPPVPRGNGGGPP